MPPAMDGFNKETTDKGVTAKLISPKFHLSGALLSSTTENDTTALNRKYQEFLSEKTSTPSDDTLTNLYHLKTTDECGVQKLKPSKIEFRLYKNPKDKPRKKYKVGKSLGPRKSYMSMKHLLENECKADNNENQPPSVIEKSFVRKLKKSLANISKSNDGTSNNNKKSSPCKEKFMPQDSRIDIYPFDHGCEKYLRTTDYAPQIISELLAQRATDCATRFWAEIFGSLHIGVAFVLVFFLQAFRFLLHSVVKSIIVGFLQMTSDYGLKPLLTVVFNGFLQPVLIFIGNLFSSVRDVLAPVWKVLDELMKPLGRLLGSIRFVQIETKRRKRIVKSV